MIYRILLLVCGLCFAAACAAQTLYRYKDDDGNWQFSDRPPADRRTVESERMATRHRVPEVNIIQRDIEGGLQLIAINEWHCPIELVVELTRITDADRRLAKTYTTVLAPNSETELFDIFPDQDKAGHGYDMEYRYMPGDPGTQYDANYLYELPFARGSKHPVTQAYPSRITHNDTGSLYAIDFAMEEGTPIHAARDGVVFATSYEHYSGGTDPDKDLPKANVVRIAHDDGTLAVYAHLSWNAIRVKPGQRVTRGQYIADSGNTGFSSGPHLHFAVLANKGMKIETVPVLFSGQGNKPLKPLTGQTLLNIE